MFLKKKSQNSIGRSRMPQPAAKGQVFSYHANRSVRTGSTMRNIEEQQRQQEAVVHRGPRLPWLKRLPSLVIALGLLLMLGMCLRLNDDVRVIAVGQKDSQVFLRDQRVYRDAVSAMFGAFMNRNKLTVNTNKVAADLKKQFPELRVVSVSLPAIGGRPVVYIQPVEPKMILVGKGMYLLDADGRALMPANQANKLSDLKIPVINDQSDVSVETGKIALPKSVVSFITEVVGQYKAKGIGVSSMTLPPGTNELHVKSDGVGYYVKYSLYGNAREEAGVYLAVKARLEAESKMPGEYIDVRVDNKAYYK
ncbi:MAG TPA: hypothetical protein VF809_00950 [Candidatus Saccharimonadales bacterium]